MRMMYYAGGPFVLNITQNLWKPEIRALAVAAGWNGVNELLVNITSTAIGPIDLGSTPYHSGITLNVSAGSRVGGERKSYPPQDGGPAIRTRIPVTINNAGIISGSGGFGGEGGQAQASAGNASAFASGGEGGAGTGLVFGGGGLCAILAADTGAAGEYDSDQDTVVPPYPSVWAQGGNGGQGGGWGQNGFPGGTGSWGGSSGSSGSGWPGDIGWLAGAVVDGNSYVTWQSTGTRLGRFIN